MSKAKKKSRAKSPRKVKVKRESFTDLVVLNRIEELFREGRILHDIMEELGEELKKAMRYPDFTSVRITINDYNVDSEAFRESQWCISSEFETINNEKGGIYVFYGEEFEELDKGPFKRTEVALVEAIAVRLKRHINSRIAIKRNYKPVFDTLQKRFDNGDDPNKYSRNKLQTFLNKHNANRDIFHDLMPFKVKEILLVATLYDTYSIEKEGRFSEQILGEYHQLNLTSMPRVTGASTSEEAMQLLHEKHFDLVIIMFGADRKMAFNLSRDIKTLYRHIRVFMLLHNNNDINYLKENNCDLSYFDRIFTWNGDSKVFFAMVKSVEDRVNVGNDTSVGMVGVILLVEDSIRYYSRYLPLLFSIVLEQTKNLIEEVVTDELYKVLRLRARPKIVLATDYEEAMQIYSAYKDYMLCLITDMEFNIAGKSVKNAGELLVTEIRKGISDLPIIIQSSDTGNVHIANNLNVSFVDKNSNSLIQDIRSFIRYFLGFGNFVFRDRNGKEIAVARSFREFEKQLNFIPDESLLYHAGKNHFSQWLMARGEIQAARIIHPIMARDFKHCEDLRKFLINIIQTFRHEQKKGKVIQFDEQSLNDESNIVSLSSGALGGKGRGLAFINNLIYDFNIEQYNEGINIKAPMTAIIGTDEFEWFMDHNNLRGKVLELDRYDEIRKLFVKGTLSDKLKSRLRILLKYQNNPLAVRSSGLFEDSLYQPFAGIFETYKLPNCHPDFEIRVQQLEKAIKLVYASVFSNLAKGYVEAINHKIEEEKMAVVIQEVVGKRYGRYFYPQISGVAQSYNYYPIAHMKPDEGFAIMAIGLGRYVVEGEKAYRFSPKYPATESSSIKELHKNSQVEFIAIDLENDNPNLMVNEDASLIKVEISEAEKHGNLRHCASVYDIENERVVPGLDCAGPRIINFANILKYNYIPISSTLENILDVIKDAIGTPVEIEFAVDIDKDKNGKASFYLLQIKPLIGNAADFNLDLGEIDRNSTVLYSDKGMGNGLISDVKDFIYIDPENFDKTKTVQIASEVEKLNNMMKDERRKYVLIGPGRWGTRDRFIGIPVTWPQISYAKVIVETSLKDFPLDASLGSHFFHNVTSLGIGYFSIQTEFGKSFVNYELLAKQKLIQKTEFFRHVRFEEAVQIKMDGRQRKSIITV